ncbi:MAG: serine/threonine protein kinase [Desmonostoc vinosum HA7617-LM4]|jgi:serine/threonine-protein kinase|nr:serine/threonine protein kinase [Desmonostoc vinosum HA7617-LM4]
MNHSSTNTTNFHHYTLQQTQLGKMCGSRLLFRDRYEILQILGRGGFGITFLAKNVVLPGNPLCVIKQLSPKITNTQSWQKTCDRFAKEAKTLAQLGSHSQIPLLLDYFEANGEFYLVQEYIQGSTLAREVRRTGPKSEAEVKQFLQELLPVLQYLHKHHVIHRDIKPQNLLRDQADQRIVLIDFGAVRDELTNAYEHSLHNIANTSFVGTMGFAPPEQFSLRPVYASDIYALGMTCIYLLTSKGPLEFNYDSDTGEICWREEVSVSDDFADVLSKMVKVPLADRFKSADEAIAALGTKNYSHSFADCLTIQPLTNNQINQQQNSQAYVPPTVRTANAIREWQAKRNAKKSHTFS